MFARDLTYFRYSINVFLGPRTLSREEYHGTRDVDVLCLVWCGARETGRGERGKAHRGREGGTRPTDVKRDASIHEALRYWPSSAAWPLFAHLRRPPVGLHVYGHLFLRPTSARLLPCSLRQRRSHHPLRAMWLPACTVAWQQ